MIFQILFNYTLEIFIFKKEQKPTKKNELTKEEFKCIILLLKRIKENNNIKDNDIKELEKYSARHPNIEIIIELNDTRNLSTKKLKAIKINQNIKFKIIDKKLEEVLDLINHKIDIYANIYTLEELIKIIANIEKIEAKIVPNHSNIQKALYISRLLSKHVEYVLNTKGDRKEEASLRGFYTKKKCMSKIC